MSKRAQDPNVMHFDPKSLGKLLPVSEELVVLLEILVIPAVEGLKLES